MRRILLVIGLVLLAAVGLWLVYATLKPMGADQLVADPDPAADREDALARWATVQARDDEDIDIAEGLSERIVVGASQPVA